MYIGRFSEDKNNIDESDGAMADIECNFKGERWAFTVTSESTLSGGDNCRESQFI